MIRRLKLIIGPATELFTNVGAVAFARIDADAATEDDSLITSLVKAARRTAERYTRRAFITQTWEISLDDQPSVIELPFGQIQSITSVKILKEDETSIKERSTNYSFTTGDMARVWLRTGYTWTTTTRRHDVMRIRFVCGYGDASTDVPEDIMEATKQIFTYYYENREMATMVGELDMIPVTARILLDNEKIYSV